MDGDFLGTGWSFPPDFENGGRAVRMVDAEEDIRQSLVILLSTRVGERVLRPSFGWRRDSLVFESMTTTFATFLEGEVERAVLFFEPRVVLDSVRFENRSDESGTIEMHVDYTVRATNSRSNLVFPFYLDESATT